MIAFWCNEIRNFKLPRRATRPLPPHGQAPLVSRNERKRKGETWLFLPISIRRKSGANHEEIDERAALCCAKKGVQDQGQARARQVGHSGGARARSRNGRAVCGPAFNDAPSYRAAETPIGREVQREVLTGQATIHPLLLARSGPSTSSSPCIASARSSEHEPPSATQTRC